MSDEWKTKVAEACRAMPTPPPKPPRPEALFVALRDFGRELEKHLPVATFLKESTGTVTLVCRSLRGQADDLELEFDVGMRSISHKGSIVSLCSREDVLSYMTQTLLGPLFRRFAPAPSKSGGE